MTLRPWELLILASHREMGIREGGPHHPQGSVRIPCEWNRVAVMPECKPGLGLR